MPLPPISVNPMLGFQAPGRSRRQNSWQRQLPSVDTSAQQRNALAVATTRMGSARTKNRSLGKQVEQLQSLVNQLAAEKDDSVELADSLQLDLEEMEAERDGALEEASNLRLELDAALR